MRRTLAILIAAIAILSLTGCTRNCDDCDECPAIPFARCELGHIANCNENVPAPAPIVMEVPKTVNPVEVKPSVVEAPKPVAPAKPISRVIEVRQAPVQPPRVRKFRSGETEPNDL